MLPASAADHFQEENRGSTSNMDTSIIGWPPCQLGASEISVLSITALPPQNPVGSASVFKMTSTIHVKILRPSISDTKKVAKRSSKHHRISLERVLSPPPGAPCRRLQIALHVTIRNQARMVMVVGALLKTRRERMKVTFLNELSLIRM